MEPINDFLPPELAGAVACISEENEKPIFLTGPAGSGKSTLIQFIRKELYPQSLCAAPTGIAALNVRGQTLHSLFRLPLGALIPGDHRLLNSKFRRHEIDLFRKTSIVIIDEISMVRADTLDAVDFILRRILKNEKPFGGKKILMAGDVFQLEPVVRAADMEVLAPYYDSPFFFDSTVIKKTGMQKVELTDIYRQSDRKFISLLSQVKNGEADEYLLEALNTRVGTRSQDPEHLITLCARKLDSEAINAENLSKLMVKSKVYQGYVKGDFNTDNLPTELNLELKVGARVMLLRNHAEKKYVNGTLATVVALLDDKVELVDDNGQLFDVEAEQWEHITYQFDETTQSVSEKVKGSFTQIPLKLAWAVTIHKSQGLTFDRVHIHLGSGTFASGQLYVALSRCRTLEGITLEKPLSAIDFRVNRRLVEGNW